MHLNIMSSDICFAEKFLGAFFTWKVSGSQMLSSFVCFKLAFQRELLLTNITLERFRTVHKNIMSCKSFLITEYSLADVTLGILFDCKVNGFDVSAQIFLPGKPFVTILTLNVTLSVQFRLMLFKCFLPLKCLDTNCTMFRSIDYGQLVHGRPRYLKKGQIFLAFTKCYTGVTPVVCSEANVITIVITSQINLIQ